MCKCPLDGKSYSLGTTIVQKPLLAGIRVLSIDGGGVRGILQLTLLKLLEEELGGKIPIQCFFDLVVGTSVGGIISLGLFYKGWSTEESISKFKELCKKAFTRRSDWKIVNSTIDCLKYLTWRFSTQSLEDTLKENFGSGDLLLGGSNSRSISLPFGANIVVTATSKGGGACIFTNYNRVEPRKEGKLPYSLIREQIPGRGIKIWEAARATSAAPTWFQHFAHVNSGRTFLDGGLHYNNPIEVAIQEQKLIWPNCPFDINLSLGCGKEVESEFPVEATEWNWLPEWTPGRQMWLLAKVAVNHLKNSLDSERTWSLFLDSQSPINASRCVRLNTPLGNPVPELHDVVKIPSLEESVIDYWSGDYQRRIIRDLASRLLASSFYFNLHERREIEQGRVGVKGEILCRFSDKSPRSEVKYLGEHFKSMKIVSGDGRPYFLVREQGRIHSHMFSLSDQVLQKMIIESKFSLSATPFETQLSAASSPLEILLCFGENPSEQYAISGFPRSLQGDSSKQ
ncbi:acyl transferase/acyl hydrolase/lysophospholipase [Halenospora varia]|nr:acyl transferase/acyl hydrolase/lysophospholipase [Halenospora varia]